MRLNKLILAASKQIIEYLEKRYADSGLAPTLTSRNEQDRDTLSKLLAAEVLVRCSFWRSKHSMV
jgi:hypothetical protein